MRSYPFFVVLAIIVGVVLYQSFQSSKAEGFQSSPKGASPALNVPATKPAPAPLAGADDPQPFAPPSTSLLAPPPGQLATVNSYPYEDPAMKKAPMSRVLNVLETIKGFLANEAPGLAQFNDSSVQLPLETVKADRSRLEDEANFMRRNPGVDGSLTEKDLDEMTANLGYLQKKWRLSANSAPLENVEGFQSGGTSTSILGDILSMFGFTAPTILKSATDPMAPTNTSTSLDGIPPPTFGGNTNTTTSTSQPATLTQLREVSLKISAEITRLQSSGTTDPVVTQRVNLLTQIRKGVDDIIKAVESGAMAPGNVPITEDAVNQFLPVISNVSSALPPLLNQLGANSALGNLFPAYGAGDISGAQVAQDLFTKYAEDFLKNISWDINVRYTGESERAVAQNIASAVASAALPQAPALGVGGPSEAPPSASPYRGWFDTILSSFPGAPSGTGAATPMPTGSTASQQSGAHATGVLVTDATQAPGSLDWKERSRQICDQVTKRGLNAYEFGCLQDPENVSANFSYRGYAKMICARLATHYDPGVPESCGCPPPTWVGWRP